MNEIKKTPLNEWHKKNGGKMVPFAGWEMPVQYAGLKEEHTAVRTKAGLFDVSHMGEIRVKGPRALESVQWFTTNDVAKLSQGQAQYSLFPNENGGVVDDLIVYCLQPGTDYLLCVNASNKEKDLAYVIAHNKGADIHDESSQWGQVAIQGPLAISILAQTLNTTFAHLKPFHFQAVVWQGSELFVARTGYTGEDGAEIFVPWDMTEKLWVDLLQVGGAQGLVPCGLGARDTLRTEMRYPLYGHEIDEMHNPYAAGLGWVIKAKDKNFVGKDILTAHKAGNGDRLVGLILEDKGIAREGFAVVSSEGKNLGQVTSGTMSPSLNQAIAIAYVPAEFAEVGTEVYIDIRGRRAKARVVKTPFVKVGV